MAKSIPKKDPQVTNGKIEKLEEEGIFWLDAWKHFLRTNIEPEWMVLCLLPVLPPELRPIIQIDGGKLMSSDINVILG